MDSSNQSIDFSIASKINRQGQSSFKATQKFKVAILVSFLRQKMSLSRQVSQNNCTHFYVYTLFSKIGSFLNCIRLAIYQSYLKQYNWRQYQQQMSQEQIHQKAGDQKLQTENEGEGMITLQGSLVNKLIKRILKDKIITAQFKKQFSAALSLFILYAQNGQAKKKYTKQDILVFLQREGLGKIAEDLRKQKKSGGEEPVSRKKGGQAVVDPQP